MTLLEHLERRGRTSTLIRLLSAAFGEFTPRDAERLRELPDEALDELTDAIALRRPWAAIESRLRQS